MPSLELLPKLPQELRDKILTYVVEDEIVGLEFVNQGSTITDIIFKYTEILENLMKDEDMRTQLQHLIYEHAILDIETYVVGKIGRDEGVSRDILKIKLRHFRRLRLWSHVPLEHIGELFDNINYLGFTSNQPNSVIGEGHWIVSTARVQRTHFSLTQQAVVEVFVKPSSRNSDWKPIQTFRVLPDAARDEDAQKWYAQELKDVLIYGEPQWDELHD